MILLASMFLFTGLSLFVVPRVLKENRKQKSLSFEKKISQYTDSFNAVALVTRDSKILWSNNIFSQSINLPNFSLNNYTTTMGSEHVYDLDPMLAVEVVKFDKNSDIYIFVQREQQKVHTKSILAGSESKVKHESVLSQRLSSKSIKSSTLGNVADYNFSAAEEVILERTSLWMSSIAEKLLSSDVRLGVSRFKEHLFLTYTLYGQRKVHTKILGLLPPEHLIQLSSTLKDKNGRIEISRVEGGVTVEIMLKTQNPYFKNQATASQES